MIRSVLLEKSPQMDKMGNITTTTLQDKDIKNLALKPKQYRKVVGNPKELYIQVNPKETKTFTLKFDNKFIKVGEWRESIFTANTARTKATQIRRELNSGKQIDMLKGRQESKYIYENLFCKIIEHKRRGDKKESHLSKVIIRHQKYFLPAFGKMDIKEIKYSDIKEILSAIFNPNDPSKSRLETIHRPIDNINEVFTIAERDEHIAKILFRSCIASSLLHARISISSV